MGMLITKTASCDTLYSWAVAQGVWHSYKETPQPGDVIIFDFQGNHTRNAHTGIVKSFSGSTAITIEGNTSITSNDNGGAVMQRSRSTYVIKGYIRPKYDSTQTAAKLIAIAESQLGVTEYPSGSNKVKYNKWYWGKEVSGSAWPWCAAFVSWIFAALAGEIEDSTLPKAGAATTTATTATATQVAVKNVTISVATLQKGMTGNGQVRTLQRILYAMGYKGADGKTIGVDGDFGANTDYAVRAFQKKNGLVQDGIVGAATWDKLIG